jgi:hypothetical protein
VPLILVHTLGGDSERARMECERAEHLQRMPFATCRWEDAASIGFSLLRRGELGAARRSLEATLAPMTERNQSAAVSGCSFVLGLLAMEEGRRTTNGPERISGVTALATGNRLASGSPRRGTSSSARARDATWRRCSPRPRRTGPTGRPGG